MDGLGDRLGGQSKCLGGKYFLCPPQPVEPWGENFSCPPSRSNPGGQTKFPAPPELWGGMSIYAFPQNRKVSLICFLP